MKSGTSWRTTWASILVGAPIAIQALLEAYSSGAFTGKTGLQLVAAIGIVLFGLVSKDSKVTGGTIVNATNDANAVASSNLTSVASGVPTQPATETK